jgi:hypothetical protein
MGVVSAADERRRRRSKNVALALLLAGLAALFYVITIVKLGDNVS